MTIKKIDEMISQLDKAVGMLIVASGKDNKTVERAKRIVMDVSFQLGYVIEKQIPKKPINDRCQACDEDIRNWTGEENFKYCCNCGRSIDWESEGKDE